MANEQNLQTAQADLVQAQSNLATAQQNFTGAQFSNSQAVYYAKLARQEYDDKTTQLAATKRDFPEFQQLINQETAQAEVLAGAYQIRQREVERTAAVVAQAENQVLTATAQVQTAQAAVESAQAASPGGAGTSPVPVGSPLSALPRIEITREPVAQVVLNPDGSETAAPPVAGADASANQSLGLDIDMGTTPQNPVTGPAAVPPSQTGYSGVAYDDDGNLMPGFTTDEDNNPVFVGGDFVEPATAASAEASRTLAAKARQQQTNANQSNVPSAADWRVRLSLAQASSYLYNAPGDVGILAPLKRTGGVIFPYTPQIETSYQAKYDNLDLTHSNYRGYFYKGSYVDNVNIRATFTAQDTREAEYLLAVIHFFKSVTKMFYGANDPNRGMPPPLVFLTGLGQFQFNQQPCVVSNFQYSLPSDVDYIRANGFNNYQINLLNRKQQGSGPPGTGILGAIAQVNRIINSDLVQGVLGNKKKNNANTGAVTQNNSNTNYTNSTYVPTKMEISIQLLPVQSRDQMSKQFDLQKFSAGQLLQQGKGFW